MVTTSVSSFQRHNISLHLQSHYCLSLIVSLYLCTVLFIESYSHSFFELFLNNSFFIHQLLFFISIFTYIKRLYLTLILILKTFCYLLKNRYWFIVILLVLILVWVWPSIAIQALNLAAPISRFRGFGPLPPSPEETFIAILSTSKILDNNVHFKKVGLLIFHSASDDTIDELLLYKNVNNNDKSPIA